MVIGELVNEKLIERAKIAANQLRERGEDFAFLDVGEVHGALVVSSDPEKVIGNVQFDLDGTVYYIGVHSDMVQ